MTRDLVLLLDSMVVTCVTSHFDHGVIFVTADSFEFARLFDGVAAVACVIGARCLDRYVRCGYDLALSLTAFGYEPVGAASEAGCSAKGPVAGDWAMVLPANGRGCRIRRWDGYV